MNYKRVLDTVRETDDILDINPELVKSGKKVLKLLIRKTNSSGGGLLIYDFVDEKLKILVKEGRLLKKIITKSFESGKTIIKGKELSIPIIMEKQKLGLVYLYGKEYSKEDEFLVSSSEDILDGRLKNEKESRDLKNIFKRYVGEKALKKILTNRSKEELEGKTHNCSILFADVNNFTEYSATHKPKEVVNFLNNYFTEMSEIAFKYEGTIDKFIGDAIMVIFGSPVIQKNHAEKAIKTAREMVRKTKAIVKEHNISKGGLSVGIATGRVIAGNIGSKKMMDYTVIEKRVNLAARLTSLAPRNTILVDDVTKNTAKNFKYKELGEIKLKGFDKIKAFKVSSSLS